jgi:hypothetical protein
VIAAGRKPRRRAAGLMIAATAIAAELPLYTTDPGDFAGLDHLVTVIPVTSVIQQCELAEELTPLGRS